MTRLFDDVFSFFAHERADWSVELEKNPFERTAPELIAELRRASAGEKWEIPEDVFTRLLATAPAWPVGRDCYLSFRIRFGEGDAGVEKTFEAHAARFKRVHKKNWRSDLLLSGKNTLGVRPSIVDFQNTNRRSKT